MHGLAYWSNKLVWLNVKTKPGHVWERKRDRKLDFPWRMEKSYFQVAVKKLKAADSHRAILIGSRLIKSVNVAQAAEIRHVHITRQAGRNWNLCSHGMSNLFKFGCTYNVSALYERGKQISAVAVAMSALRWETDRRLFGNLAKMKLLLAATFTASLSRWIKLMPHVKRGLFQVCGLLENKISLQCHWRWEWLINSIQQA